MLFYTWKITESDIFKFTHHTSKVRFQTSEVPLLISDFTVQTSLFRLQFIQQTSQFIQQTSRFRNHNSYMSMIYLNYNIWTLVLNSAVWTMKCELGSMKSEAWTWKTLFPLSSICTMFYVKSEPWSELWSVNCKVWTVMYEISSVNCVVWSLN